MRQKTVRKPKASLGSIRLLGGFLQNLDTDLNYIFTRCEARPSLKLEFWISIYEFFAGIF